MTPERTDTKCFRRIMSTKQNVYSIFYRVEVGLVRAFPRYISIEAEVRRLAALVAVSGGAAAECPVSGGCPPS